MSWQSYINGFGSYLQLEKSLSGNSVEAYLHDVAKLVNFLEIEKINVSPEDVQLAQLERFVIKLNEIGLEAQSQARIISGLRAFYKYLMMEDLIKINPTELLAAPKL
jgi:integrase/recombinase XerD